MLPGSARTTLGPPFSRHNHQKSPRTVHTLARGAKRNRPDGAVGSAGGSCGSPGHVPLVCDTRGPAEPSPSRLAGSHSKGRVLEVESGMFFSSSRFVCALRYLARGLMGKSSGCEIRTSAGDTGCAVSRRPRGIDGGSAGGSHEGAGNALYTDVAIMRGGVKSPLCVSTDRRSSSSSIYQISNTEHMAYRLRGGGTVS